MSESIYYKSPLGALLIKAEGDTVAEISFVNKDHYNKINEDDLEYLVSPSDTLNKAILQLDNYFAGNLFQFDLPLAQAGTTFQQTVWAALQKINYGKTCSYSLLSKQLGNIKAIRAVGTANGRNNIAIIVPCHRVIGSDGSLVGYAGNLWRKKWLLQHEAKYANGVQTLF